MQYTSVFLLYLLHFGVSFFIHSFFQISPRLWACWRVSYVGFHHFWLFTKYYYCSKWLTSQLYTLSTSMLWWSIISLLFSAYVCIMVMLIFAQGFRFFFLWKRFVACCRSSESGWNDQDWDTVCVFVGFSLCAMPDYAHNFRAMIDVAITLYRRLKARCSPKKWNDRENSLLCAFLSIQSACLFD